MWVEQERRKEQRRDALGLPPESQADYFIKTLDLKNVNVVRVSGGEVIQRKFVKDRSELDQPVAPVIKEAPDA